jgi:protein-arginine kinase activator protein McsA
MQIHDDFEFEEKRRLYYAVYAFKLLVNEVSIEDLLDFIKELEEEEEYEACAGIRDAIDNYINKQMDEY